VGKGEENGRGPWFVIKSIDIETDTERWEREGDSHMESLDEGPGNRQPLSIFKKTKVSWDLEMGVRAERNVYR